MTWPLSARKKLLGLRSVGADGGSEIAESLAIEAPGTSLIDRAIDIRITGVRPGAPVEYAASLVDDTGTEWQ